MKKSMKRFWISILCVFCILPAIFLASGKFTIRKPGGFSTMGVIIGPIVGLDDALLVDPPAENEWSSATGVVRNTAYTDGGLRNYKSLYVVNDKFSKSNGDFKYSSFVKYFKIERTDGRPIYDDDGVLDVRWWSNGVFTASDEVVDYAADLYVRTQVLNYNYKGFLGTILNAKFKSGAYFDITWDRGEDPEESITSNVHDKNANNMGSGNYRNGGVNPGPEYYKLTDMHYHNSPYVTVVLNGTGYWENGWWGGCYDYVDIYSFMSGFMPRANRNWSNSLTSSAAQGTYNGKVAYYSPKSFTPVATNLNNYIKVNGVQATPTYGSSVAPYKDGHHISISSEGRTDIEIENGSEGSYTTYYCFVDTKLPDVSYTYHNANALDKRVAGSIMTNANGSKSQTINEGTFRDQVQVNFGYDASSESPESATYTFNGKTYNLTSGTWLSEEGSYTVTITDKAGNTTVSRFVIDKSNPNYNLGRLQSDKSYKISKWYLADIPYGYTGYGSYSFATKDDALSFACESEALNKVTKYTLNNISDFTATHLVASGNTVKVGDYYYYKSKDNPNLYLYYFDVESLNEVIKHYAQEYVSGEQIYKINSTLSPNNYGNTIDEKVIDNKITFNGIEAYIVNNFTFKYLDDNDTYKIYYDYQEGSGENWKEMAYGYVFKNQVTSHGLYKIKEVDYVGHETTYYVYLDLQAPLLDIEAKIYGKDKTITQTISLADIPTNGELIFYYEDFKILEVVEDDRWWVMEVRCPDNTIKRYTYLDELPNFKELGSGEFTITVADRVGNTFKFKVVLLGKAPEATFETINANTQLKVKIIPGESFNTITQIKIYRNGICLNSEIGYDELPEDDTNSLIFISPTTYNYIFSKGGIYSVEITDNFGRTLIYEFKYEKDLPTGVLVGVEHNGRTKDEVQFIYDNNKYFVVVSKNNKNYESSNTIDKNLTTLYFLPEADSEISYSIQLIDRIDTENYNIYLFTIKTIKPIIILNGVEPNGTTGGNVFATWENSEEQYTAHYTLNNTQQEYRKGQVLSVEGSYEITLVDEIGNSNTVKFYIDKSINITIADTSGKTYKIEEIRYINFDIRIIENENLNITITKNEEDYAYNFGLMITEEGDYLVRVTDEYGNNLFFTFTIDKTAPQAKLYGVENFGVTKGSAWITASEGNLTCWYIKDEIFRDTYTIGQELTTHGKYVVYVSDLAKNYISFEFEIDKEISYGINTYAGGISNGGVRLIAYENLKILMLKDGKNFDYSFEQIIDEEGEYSFTITDDLGNRTSSFFNIIKKKKQNLHHILQENIEVTNVTLNDEEFEFTILENELYLYDEGTYVVDIFDGNKNEYFSFQITLDTTPPTLELVNVENGGSTKKVVIIKNISEKPYDLKITVDGVNFDYKVGDEIEKSGQFKVILTDEAGNSSIYTFERVYSLNGSSIAVLAGLGALVILFIILLIKSRHKYNADIVEESIEETIIEDDFNDGQDISVDGGESDENGDIEQN